MQRWLGERGHEGKIRPDARVQWEEWGCPKDKEYYEYMKSYSPVDNIKRAGYPNILVTAGADRNISSICTSEVFSGYCIEHWLYVLTQLGGDWEA